jgi:hypothetical protein
MIKIDFKEYHTNKTLFNKVIAQLTVLAVVYPLLCSSTSCTNINSLVVIVNKYILMPTCVVGNKLIIAILHHR